MTNTTKPLLAIFDFDHTIVDDNSDIVLRRMLGKDDALADLKNLMGNWTEYMQKIFHLLHDRGISREQIENAIVTISPVLGIPFLIRELHSRDTEIIIISDSNSFLINHWLRKHDLYAQIRQIFTNPARFDDAGVLKIDEYHSQDWCRLSEKNLCKGHVMEEYMRLRSREGIEFRRTAYIGDGANDYCPVLRLTANDCAFPRLDYPLVKILKDNAAGNEDCVAKAEILPWHDGHEIWQNLAARIPEFR